MWPWFLLPLCRTIGAGGVSALAQILTGGFEYVALDHLTAALFCECGLACVLGADIGGRLRGTLRRVQLALGEVRRPATIRRGGTRSLPGEELHPVAEVFALAVLRLDG